MIFKAVRQLLLGSFLIGTYALLWAQTSTGTILGTVMDSSGATIAGVSITVREIHTNSARQTTTNEKGYYEVPLLPPGTYQLDAEQTGFKKASRTLLTLDTDQKMEIPITLNPGDVKETVEVTSQSPLLETTTSSIGQVIDNSKIVNLPLSNRNLLQLDMLVPGVQDFGATLAPATSGAVNFGRWNANGGMTNTNEFMLDGATAILANMNAASIIPTIDAIDEFKIQTNAMPAEYGRTGGAVINATYKSGTNDLHGTVYEFWRNRVLNANTWINDHNGSPKGFTNINTFGFSAGGPVYFPKIFNGRNRLFFFTNYEGYRDVTPVSTLLTVPTVAEKGGDFSQLRDQNGNQIVIYDPTSTYQLPNGSYSRTPFTGNVIPSLRLDQVAVKAISYYPNPNVAPVNSFTNAQNYLSQTSAYNRQNEWSVRVDYSISDTKKLFTRYSQSSQGGGAANYFGNTPSCSECLVHGNPAGAFSPRGGGSSLFIYPKNTVVGYTQAISPTALLDLRASLNRQLLSRLPQSGNFDLSSLGFPPGLGTSVFYPQFPPMSIANFQGLGTSSNGDLLRRGDTTFATEDSLTLVRGNHTFKLGGDFRIFRYDDINTTNDNPTFNFTQTWTQQNPFSTNPLAGAGIASFLLGTPASAITTIPASVSIQWFYIAAYLQDDWRINSRLTLNLGLRYDIETPFTERHNRTSIFDPTVSNAATVVDTAAVGGLQYMGKDTSSRSRNPTDFNNLGPRIGLAYKLSNAMVLRTAYGILYAPSMVYGYGGNSFGALGYSADTNMVVTSDGGLTPANYLRDPYPQGLNQPTGNSLGSSTFLGQTISNQLRHNIVIPYAQQYNAGWEYQLRSTLFGVGYVGTHGVHQVINVPLDQLTPTYYQLGSSLNRQVANPFFGIITSGSLATPTISYGQLLRPFPEFADVQNQFQTSGNMHYNSLQTRVEMRHVHGISLLASYTWSKNIGDVGERYWTTNSVQNQYDLHAEKSLSPLDIRNAITIAGLWEMPFGRGRAFASSTPAFLEKFISGWQLDGTATIQSGQPLSITNVTNQVGFGAGSRPNRNSPSASLPSSQRTPSKWFNTSVFSLPPQYTFGNEAPRDSELRGPPTDLANLSLLKNTSWENRITLQFRAEFYNAFNHVNWAAPGTIVGSNTFGVVSQKGPASTQTTGNANRTGQLALKLIF